MQQKTKASISIIALAMGTACGTYNVPHALGKPDVVVCAEPISTMECDYIGGEGLRQALLQSENKSSIWVSRGDYIASSYTDTPFEDVEIRAFLTIKNKELTIIFEEGAVLLPNPEFASSAILAVQSNLRVEGLTIKGFRYGEAEDKYYDGHGFFVIGGEVSLKDTTIHDVQKMAFTGRGDAILRAKNLVITDSHLGIWLEETAQLHLQDSEVVRSESASIAAYDSSQVLIKNSVFEDSEDDGLYTENMASLKMRGGMLRGNAPFAARAADSSEITLIRVGMKSNAANTGEEGEGTVRMD